MSYKSKYKSSEIENLLDKVASGTDDDGNVLDSEMSDTSENAVQNKVIKAYIDTIVGNIGAILDNINGEVI